MNNGRVVFDNNVYKRVGVSKLDSIIAAEKEKGLRPIASTTVLQELLARVRDEDREKRGQNRRAIRKMATHCRNVVGGRVTISFVSHADSQVYRLITRAEHPDDRRMFDGAAQLMEAVSAAGVDDALDDVSDPLSVIEHAVCAAEDLYVKNLQMASTGNADYEPNEMKRRFDYAERSVRRTERLYEVKFEPQRIVQNIINIAKFTEVGFALHDGIVAELRAKGRGHGQHRNSIWDEEIVSATSIHTQIDGSRVLVITEEPRLVRAALAAGAGARVLSLVDYEAMLGLS